MLLIVERSVGDLFDSRIAHDGSNCIFEKWYLLSETWSRALVFSLVQYADLKRGVCVCGVWIDAGALRQILQD